MKIDFNRKHLLVESAIEGICDYLMMTCDAYYFNAACAIRYLLLAGECNVGLNVCSFSIKALDEINTIRSLHGCKFDALERAEDAISEIYKNYSQD